MTDDETLRQELSAAQRHKDPLGIDTKGRDHYWCPIRQCVWVDDGEIAQIERVTDLGNWVEFVADRVGWESVRYTRQNPLAQIAGQLQREGAA